MLAKIRPALLTALRGQRGFTLVELMVVIAILGILAAVAIPRFSGATDRADAAKVEADMSTLASALEVYRVNHGSYPASLNILLQDGLIARVPLPPHATEAQNGWSGNYTYQRSYTDNNDTYSLTVNVPDNVGKYISAGHISADKKTVTYP